jgi:glutathione S-transferase
LHLYGMPFSLRQLGAATDAAAVRVANPLGRIPALTLDDGEALIDSVCIIDWLDEQAGERALLPRQGPERRRVLRLLALAQGATETYVAAYYERTRRPATHVWAPWLERLEGQVASGLAALEAVAVDAAGVDAAAGGPWLLETMSHADVAVACGILAMRADMAHLAPEGRYPRLDRLVQEADGMAAFAATRG